MISVKHDNTKKNKKYPDANSSIGTKRPFTNAFPIEQISSSPNSFKMKKVKMIPQKHKSFSESECTSDSSTNENEKTFKRKELKNGAKEKFSKLNLQAAANKTDQKSNISSHQTQLSSESSTVLLLNFDLLKEEELRGFLKKRGVNPEKIICINKPVALVSVNNKDMEKALLSCSGVPYKSRKLSALSVSGYASDVMDISSDISGDMTCVFAYMIPKSLTKENIENIIGFKPKDVHLLTSGPKNKHTNACFIECLNAQEANRIVDTLNGRSESGYNIRAMLRHKPRTKFLPVTETSLVIENFPFTSDIDDVRREFPTSTSVESARRGQFHLHFKTRAAREEAASTVAGKVVGGRRLRIVAITAREHVLTVSNIPFTAEAEEVQQVYPIAIKVSLCKKKNGKSLGIALVYFATNDALQAALNETATKQIQGRQLRAKIADPEDSISSQPTSSQQEMDIKEKYKFPDLKIEVQKGESKLKMGNGKIKSTNGLLNKNDDSKQVRMISAAGTIEKEKETHSKMKVKSVNSKKREMIEKVQHMKPHKDTNTMVVSSESDEDKLSRKKKNKVEVLKCKNEKSNARPTGGIVDTSKKRKGAIDSEEESGRSEEDSDEDEPQVLAKLKTENERTSSISKDSHNIKQKRVTKFPTQVGSESEDDSGSNSEEEDESDVEMIDITGKKARHYLQSKHISNENLSKKNVHSGHNIKAGNIASNYVKFPKHGRKGDKLKSKRKDAN